MTTVMVNNCIKCENMFYGNETVFYCKVCHSTIYYEEEKVYVCPNCKLSRHCETYHKSIDIV